MTLFNTLCSYTRAEVGSAWELDSYFSLWKWPYSLILQISIFWGNQPWGLIWLCTLVLCLKVGYFDFVKNILNSIGCSCMKQWCANPGISNPNPNPCTLNQNPSPLFLLWIQIWIQPKELWIRIQIWIWIRTRTSLIWNIVGQRFSPVWIGLNRKTHKVVTHKVVSRDRALEVELVLFHILYILAPCQWGSHPDSHPTKLIIVPARSTIWSRSV